MRAVELETSLSRLDERLDAARDIVVGETKAHLSEKDQILADVWTRFGANSQRVSLLDQNIHILETIHDHRMFANDRIASIGSELQAMKASLEYLRPLASSLLLRGGGSSVGLIMRQVEMGMERLSSRGAGGLMEVVGYEAELWPSDISHSEA